MAITFVAASTVITGTSLIVVPSGSSQGDLLITASMSTSTVSTPSGWTSIGASTSSGLYIYYKFAASTDSYINPVGRSATAKSVMLAYSGVLANDVNSSQIEGNSTSQTTPSITTLLNNDVIISLYGFSVTGGSTLTASTPTGTTLRASSNAGESNTGLLIVDEIQNTAGASTPRTSTISQNDIGYRQAISFSPTNTSSFFFMF